MPAVIHVLGYSRVSTAEQAASGHSLDQQPERLAAWCRARSDDATEYRLVDVIVDRGVSASKPLDKRAGGKVLIERMARGDAQLVLVTAIDRIYRDAVEGLVNTVGKGGHNLPLASVSEPIDTSTAMGRFLLAVNLARAQLERELTCERNLTIARGLRAEGKPNGHTPFGCVVVAGRLYRDPATWPRREQAVVLRTGAGGGKPMTAKAIAGQFTTWGIPAPRGGAKWDDKAISRIVRTHDGLKHIPALPAPHEAAVSEAASA